MTKIIFLDVDGVLLPHRAYALPGNGGYEPMVVPPANDAMPSRHIFDPVAVAMIHRLINRTGARLVWSSSWANYAPDVLAHVMTVNGLSAAHFHQKSITLREPGMKRAEEIAAWLESEGSCSEWIALDNDPSLQGEASPLHRYDPSNLRRPHFSPHDGVTLSVYSQAAAILGSTECLIDWILATDADRRRPTIFTSQPGQSRIVPRFGTVGVLRTGFLVVDGIWYRLHHQLQESDRLKSAINAVDGELSIVDVSIEELAELLPINSTEKTIGLPGAK